MQIREAVTLDKYRSATPQPQRPQEPVANLEVPKGADRGAVPGWALGQQSGGAASASRLPPSVPPQVKTVEKGGGWQDPRSQAQGGSWGVSASGQPQWKADEWQRGRGDGSYAAMSPLQGVRGGNSQA